MIYLKIFKPDNFMYYTNGARWADPLPPPERLARKAQSIFEAYLKKSSQTVYSPDGMLIWNAMKDSQDTHQALLINVQKIETKECEHEPIAHTPIENYQQGFHCKHCGKNLKISCEVIK